jgi:hypothetical protein
VASAQGGADPLGDLGGARMQRAEAAGRRDAPLCLNLYRFNIRRIVADLRFDVVGQCGEHRGLCRCASST